MSYSLYLMSVPALESFDRQCNDCCVILILIYLHMASQRASGDPLYGTEDERI